MRRIPIVALLLWAISAMFLAASECHAIFTFGCPRDAAVFASKSEAQCHFPPLLNPCAAPCRPPGLQAQAVPCPFRTSCPAIILPDYGISYGQYPYPLFEFW
jgi:hypothetical protein